MATFLRRVLLVCTQLALGCGAAFAADRFVSTTGRDTANDCLTSTSPCDTITHAVAQSASGDVIKVARGTYLEAFVVQASTTLTLSGSWGPDFGSRDAASFGTRIYGALVEAGSGEVIDVTLDGVTVMRATGLNARSTDDGVLTVTLTSSAVRRNRSGGVSAIATETSSLTLNVSSSLVSTNHVPPPTFLGGCAALLVGAFDTSTLTATVSDTLIERTSVKIPSTATGVAAFEESGSTLNLSLARTQVSRNRGGGIYAYRASVAIVDSSILSNRHPGVDSYGGAFTVANTVIAKNNRGVHAHGGSLDVVNSTIRGNTTVCGSGNESCAGGIGIFQSSAVALKNTIVWGNRAINGTDDLSHENATVTVDHCDLGEVSGTITDLGGTISADPLLVSSKDAHLTSTSPAINAGTCSGAPATDFEGDPRPTGGGCDIGADEFVP